jgi:hypothetical protein
MKHQIFTTYCGLTMVAIIQPIFFELCGINMKSACADQIELLAKSLPLTNGNAYETMDGIQVWRLHWGGELMIK